MEKVLLDYVFERVCVIGFKPVTVPDLVSTAVTEACGVVRNDGRHLQVNSLKFFPKNFFSQYTLDGEPDVALSGTAEMGIASLLQGRTFEIEQLPVRLVSLSR